MSEDSPPNPPNLGVVGMLIFLSALTMLFLASLLAYTMIRVGGRFAPPSGALHVPGLFWISTGVILISSFTIQHALGCVRREKQSHFKLSMTATLGLALLFIAIQTPALAHLLAEHERLRAHNMNLYGLMFCLVLLHAAHVLGGLIPMVVIWIKALRGGYDHEQHRPVRYLTMYWHFLDAVWLLMFTTLLTLA